MDDQTMIEILLEALESIAKRGPEVEVRTPEAMPHMKPFGGKQVVQNCIHCHMVKEYALRAKWQAGELTENDLYVFPAPQQVGLQVWTSYYGLRTATQRLATSRDLLASAQESANVAAERYRAGVGNIIDLLTAEAALENARAEEVQARADWFVAVAQLAHDTGNLTR